MRQLQWHWSDDPRQGVLVDDSGTVRRIVVEREPIAGELGSGDVFVQGLAITDQWLNTWDEAAKQRGRRCLAISGPR